MLITGDNLEVMQGLDPESIDLIATDPPFNTGRDFGEYRDGWPWCSARCAELHWLSDNHVRAWNAVDIARSLHSDSMGAFLCFLSVRVIAMHHILKPTGSLYLHCDQTANSYIRLMLDAIFGARNFRNEIVWSYCTGGANKRKFAAKHDNIYFYSKGDAYHFEYVKERSYCAGTPPGFKGVEKFQDETGRWFTLVNMRDTWAIDALGRSSGERVGYPTQKPVALYERIISASSPAGGVVIDPFMGSGTTLVAAQRTGRIGQGIDINPKAIELANQRLAETLV